ncbi:peptidylprolyl isomerase [Candidatus Proelusimicrobium excrementi]|uniref:peptidylprolyl isomerase n=1 Tax=Candidatus Proelusimicrobium excrementi TaxID=3416222 RepID=UPI003CA1A94B|nr:peptidylprolyl isomerase [Elusimicrobiaceae bacterium]
MKKLLLPILALTLCACHKKQEEQHTPQAPVLAQISGEAITEADFNAQAAELDDSFKKFLQTDIGKENFLNYLINEKLMLKAAKDAGLEQNPDYIKEIKDIETEQKTRLEKAKAYALNRLLLQKLYEDGTIAVSEEEIKAYHKKYPYQIYLLEILLTDPKEAADVTRAIRNSKTKQTFEDAVKKFSKDPVSKKNKGALEPFIPGEYLPQIEVAAANTPTYQVQGFIKTPRGFHIIMKTGEERLTYNQAKERIRQILEKQKMDAYLNSLKSKYRVEVTTDETK